MNTEMQKNEYFDMYTSEDAMWWYKGLRDFLNIHLNLYTNKDSNILDAGSGTGKNMEYFMKLGYKITGLELSEYAIELCKERGINNIHKRSITDTGFADKQFDFIYCADVLGLLEPEDQIKAVKEFIRILKPKGKLLIHSAALEILRSQHDKVCNLKTRFNNQSLKKLFSEEKIDIIKISYRIFFLFPLVALVKIIKKFSRENAKSDQSVPPTLLNNLFTKVLYLENFFGKRIKFPFGSSIYIIVEKK